MTRAGCDRYAEPRGGAAVVEALAAALRPGQTGCLEPGTYVGDVKLDRGGERGRPVAIESASGRDRARIVGRLYVTRGAHDLVLRDLVLDGRNAQALPSPTVDGVRITFDQDEITNGHTGICFDLGSTRFGVARDVVIERSRIYDCGRLPATNFDHGVYVAVATGTRIVDNDIYDNAYRGVQLYPQAQRTLVARNVIDGNGEGVIFGGNTSQVSSGNRVVANVISNSRVRANVEVSWIRHVGTGNVVIGNCLWGGVVGDFDLGTRGRPRLARNRVADPEFVDAGNHDYRLRAGSPCAGLGPARQPIG